MVHCGLKVLSERYYQPHFTYDIFLGGTFNTWQACDVFKFLKGEVNTITIQFIQIRNIPGKIHSNNGEVEPGILDHQSNLNHSSFILKKYIY